MLLILVTLIWFQSESLETAFLNVYRYNMETRASLFVNMIEPHLGENLEDIADEIKHWCKVAQTRISVIDNQGNVLLDSYADPKEIPNLLNQPEVLSALRNGVGVANRYSNAVEADQLFVATTIAGKDGEIYIIRMGMASHIFEKMLAMARRDTLLLSMIMILCMILAGLYTNLRILRPIAQIRRRCHEITADSETTFEITGGHRIIDGLAADMSNMIENLHKKIKQQQSDLSRYDEILSSMTEGIIAVDSHCIIFGLNPEAGRILGVPTLCEGMSLHSLYRGNELAEFAEKIMKERRPATADIKVGENDSIILRVKGSLLKLGEYELTGVVLTLNDRTRIYQLENFRRDFIADVSHEIKTPLTVISGAIESLRDGAYSDPGQSEDFFNMIVRQSEKLNNLIRDILSISALESTTDAVSRFCDFDLVSVLQNVVEMTEQKSNIRMELPESLVMYGDPYLIDQAISNLVNNAVKYAFAGEILVKAWLEEEIIIIQVIDNGVGIPREHLPRLFERFYRIDKDRSRKLGGTGLGLAIVKHVAQHHHGMVTVESSPGNGCIFTIRLPYNLETKT